MKLVLSLVILFILTACSSIVVKTPVASIYSPEVIDKSSMQAGVRLQPTRLQTVTTDASSRPPTASTQNDRANLISTDLAYGLTEKIQLTGGITDSLGLFGILFRAQYQFIGDTSAYSKEGWSTSIIGESHLGVTTKNGNQNGTFGDGGYPWNASATVAAHGMGLSTGYRFNSKVMTFAGASINTIKITTKINQEAANGDAGGSYQFHNNGNSWAAGLGAKLGNRFFHVVPTVQWVDYQIDGRREHDTLWGLSIEFGGEEPEKKAEKKAEVETPENEKKDVTR